MQANLSVADLYFLQEFAKLARSENGALSARFKSDVIGFIFQQPATSLSLHQSEHPTENLKSERNPMLAKYFGEEFEAYLALDD